MTAGKTSRLVPKLRFPEFQIADDWKRDQIGNIANIFKGKGVSKADISERGLTPCIRYAELYTHYGEVIREVLSHTYISPEDLVLSQAEDVIVPASGETRADIARAACVVSAGVALGGDLNILRSDLNGLFLSYLLNSPVRYTIALLAQGDTVVHLYPGQLSRVTITYPLPAEQQRIADCLGSLDDLIAAEGRKLEALRQNKQALMNQLFPQPGETRPRLRFPEFQGTGEWQLKIAGELFAQRKDKGKTGLPLYSVTINEGMVLRSSFDRNFYDIEDASGNKKARKGDIVYNMMRMWQGACGVAPEDCLVSPAYVVLTPKKGVCSEFFQVLFKLPASIQSLTAYSRGLTKDRLRLYFDDFTAVPLTVPEYDEQRRIADCSTSLDTQIDVQATKINVLKTHKRGLLQHLFPPPEVR